MSTKFKQLQREWYARLESEGFKDIESPRHPDSLAYSAGDHAAQTWKLDPGEPMPLDSAQALLHSRDIMMVCESITLHGNSRLDAMGVKHLFKLHCEGESNRAIARRIGLSEYLVRAYLKKFKTWQELL